MRIPSCLTDITADWVAELLYTVLGVPEPAEKDGTHNGITLLQVSAARFHYSRRLRQKLQLSKFKVVHVKNLKFHLQIRAATTGEGFRDSCHVTARSASEPEERTHHLLVEVVPSDEDLRAILSRHGLFSKEILIYEQVRRFLWRFQFMF